MRVWVIRHADAVHAAGLDDADRPLSEMGREEAMLLARHLAHRSAATLILSSPVLRARQTAELIHTAMPASAHRLADALSTSGSVGDAIAEIRSIQAAECVVVSHEPLTSQMVSLLAGNGQPAVHFTPATAVLMNVHEKLQVGRAQVLEVVSPDTLRRADIL